MSNSNSQWRHVGEIRTVLITGTGSRANSLAESLRSAGHHVTVCQPASVIDSDALPAGIDGYLQLPSTVALRGDTLVARVRSFLVDGLLARFELVEKLLPLLAEKASVVLVAGNVASGSPVPDDQHSRLALLRVLAHATRAELTERDVRVRVVDNDHDDTDLLNSLFETGPTAQARDVAGPLSGRDYQDWRTEMMGLVTEVSV